MPTITAGTVDDRDPGARRGDDHRRRPRRDGPVQRPTYSVNEDGGDAASRSCAPAARPVESRCGCRRAISSRWRPPRRPPDRNAPPTTPRPTCGSRSGRERRPRSSGSRSPPTLPPRASRRSTCSSATRSPAGPPARPRSASRAGDRLDRRRAADGAVRPGHFTAAEGAAGRDRDGRADGDRRDVSRWTTPPATARRRRPADYLNTGRHADLRGRRHQPELHRPAGRQPGRRGRQERSPSPSATCSRAAASTLGPRTTASVLIKENDRGGTFSVFGGTVNEHDGVFNVTICADRRHGWTGQRGLLGPRVRRRGADLRLRGA